jgi:hypothetical protein
LDRSDERATSQPSIRCATGHYRENFFQNGARALLWRPKLSYNIVYLEQLIGIASRVPGILVSAPGRNVSVPDPSMGSPEFVTGADPTTVVCCHSC